MTEFLIRAQLTGWSGYGQIAEWLGRGLEASGIPVRYQSYRTDRAYRDPTSFVESRMTDDDDCEWCLHLATPDLMYDLSKRTVVFTMWESSGLPPGSVAWLNRAEAIIVPCRWNAANFAACGVTRPIYVCPLGYARSEGYVPRPIDWSRPFTFGMAGRLAHGGCRKGLSDGAWAYHEAFGDMAGFELQIKVWPDCVPHLDLPTNPNIKLVTHPMMPHELAAWYHGLHCYFAPTRGEGWGLHTLQAMACGRPVIAPMHSGTADFFTEDCGWPLEYTEHDACLLYHGMGKWAVPNRVYMKDLLWFVGYEHPRVIEWKGNHAAEQASNFTWDHTASRLMEILKTVGCPTGEPCVA